MTTTIPIWKQLTLSTDELRSLRTVVGAMIPASLKHGVPGADDEKIFADIASSGGRDLQTVRAALAELDALAGGCIADAPADSRKAAINAFRSRFPALVGPLVALTTRCYYRDDRVMRAIGMEPRPPFPAGFNVEQGDWSLLDPVRARGPIWRKAT